MYFKDQILKRHPLKLSQSAPRVPLGERIRMASPHAAILDALGAYVYTVQRRKDFFPPQGDMKKSGE